MDFNKTRKELEKQNFHSTQEFKELLHSYNELKEANDLIEEDNKSYMEKISNMGDTYVKKNKYTELKEAMNSQEKEKIKFHN